jgi:hypothetical protein
MSVARTPIFVLRMRPLPGADPEHALRWLLKIALRRFKLRCISIESEALPLRRQERAARHAVTRTCTGTRTRTSQE